MIEIGRIPKHASRKARHRRNKLDPCSPIISLGRSRLRDRARFLVPCYRGCCPLSRIAHPMIRETIFPRSPFTGDPSRTHSATQRLVTARRTFDFLQRKNVSPVDRAHRGLFAFPRATVSSHVFLPLARRSNSEPLVFFLITGKTIVELSADTWRFSDTTIHAYTHVDARA